MPDSPASSPARASRRWLLPLLLAVGLSTLGAHMAVLWHRASGNAALQDSGALTLDNMNENLKQMEYAVRGEVPIRAEEIKEEMQKAQAAGEPNPYNFSKLLPCNIGNPQAVGQAPISFYRQVLGLVDNPGLLAASSGRAFRKQFPADVVERAQELSSAVGNTGAYSHSQGVELVRQDICKFIEERDEGPPCDPKNLFLLNGASSGINSVLTALIASPKDAVLVPVPQYPIYSALIALLGGKMVSYYLDEEKGWGLSMEELQRALGEARQEGLNVKSLVLINPGNPTGQVLSEEDLKAVVRFCAEERLLLLADEVYQENVYAEDAKFISARKIASQMASEEPELPKVELVSFHSTSKGLIGECGRRGGYMEFWNIDDDVHKEIYKLQSAQLCSNLDGQVMADLMVRPPRQGEASYELFAEESGAIYEGLRRKAEVLAQRLNDVEGVTTNAPQGAMYAFPRIELPQGAIDAARAQGMAPDLLYCLSLLEATGIITVPGSGFGQKEGTWHFRITFLPAEEDLYKALDAFKIHHEAFVAKYS